MYATITHNKSGGCSDLINYLDKEKSITHDFANYLDKENQLLDTRDEFFNGVDDEIDKFTVIDGIDNNCKGLSKDESRFFSLTINPSEKEIGHIDTLAHLEALKIQASGIEEYFSKIKEEIARNLLKEYTIQCMDNYAKNFGREDKGLIDNKDLVWYGKVERDRYWKYNSPEVEHNAKILSQIKKIEKIHLEPEPKIAAKIEKLKSELIRESDVRKGGKDEIIKSMMPKSGSNYHIHVVVSRRDKEQKLKLSPLAKARSNSEHKVAILEKNERGEMVKVGERECKAGFNRNNFTNSMEKSFDTAFNYSRSWSETYEARKLRKEDPERYKEVLKEKYIEEHKKERQPEKVISKDHELEKIQSFSKRALNKFTHDAGMKYIQQAKPYIQVVDTAIKGISVLRQNSELNKQVRQKALSNYDLLARNSHLLARNVITKAIPTINPYMAAIKVIQTGINIASQSYEISR